MDESRRKTWRKWQAWWYRRQGLDGRLTGRAPAEVLEETGWARSVGGSGPYVGLFARCGASREAVDEAVARLNLHELPAARGCTYVVPASAFALALKLGQGGPEADMRVARKLGVTDAEIDRLCQAVLDGLGDRALDPEELREAAAGAARSLGEEGKKKGVSTTLPLALGRLQSAGEIRRVPTNGRLDQQRYRYTRWRPNPLSGFRLSPEECSAEVARRFFSWIGPARLAEFQAFAGLGVKAARAAVEPLGLVRAPEADEAPGGGRAEAEEHLMLPDDAAALEAFEVPREPHYALVSSLDGTLVLRRDVKGLLAPEDQDREVAGEKGRVAAGSLMDLPSHAILDRGRLIGLWEFDPQAAAAGPARTPRSSGSGSIAWCSFTPPTAELRERVRATEEMIREHLGDVRSFSLDSPKSRVPRIEALRAAQPRWPS